MKSKNKSQLSLPFLRFKGFEGEWDQISLEKISDIKKGKGISKNKLSSCGKNKCILYGELFTTYNSVIIDVVSRTNDNGYISKANSLLFPCSSTSLKDYFPCLSLNEEKIHLGGDISIFEINNNYLSNCLSYMFNSPRHLKNIFSLTRGVTINHLYSNDIKTYSFFFPSSLQEQQKIAKFFSLLDKQIALWERKLELYLLFYKYYLRKMFLLHKKITTWTRFKEFKNKWDEISLEKISDIKKGKGISKNKLSKDGKNKCILYGELFTTYKNVIMDVVSRTNDNGYISKTNSLLFPCSSTSLKDYFPCLSLNEEKIHLGGDISIFEINGKYISDCLSYMFNSPEHLKNILSLTRGVTINHLYSNDLKKYLFLFPPSLEEQQKISNFFSTIDENIHFINEKIKTMQKLKLYFLDKIFL